MLEAKNIRAAWGKNIVLNGINLTVAPKEILCLSGPNGSGKSTLLSVMAGLAGEDRLRFGGSITLDGKDIYSMKPIELAQKTATLLQSEYQTWNYNVTDVIFQGRYCRSKNGRTWVSQEDKDIVQKIIKDLEIENIAEKNVFEISGGEYQKVRIARCLAQKPDYLLLDEPAANLDFAYQDELFALLKKIAVEKNIGVLVSIHDLNTASRFCDKLALLQKNGPCYTGACEDLLKPDLLKQIYPGTEFEVFQHPAYHCLQVYTLSSGAGVLK